MKVQPSPVMTENLCMDNTEKHQVVEHLISTIVHPLPLSLCCASREPWLISDPSTVPTVCFCTACPQSLVSKVSFLLMDAFGNEGIQNNHWFTLTQTYSHTQAHAYRCTRIHSATPIRCCICVQYINHVVSDAVLCMLTCRWRVTNIHSSGRLSSLGWLSKPMQALRQLYIALFNWRKSIVTGHKLFYRPPIVKGPLGQTAALIDFKLFEGAHNLAFDVRQNLATASVGRRREKGRQTGVLQLSVSPQSGMGQSASNCLFILCQRDLHISMILCTAREVWEQRKEASKERRGKYTKM